MQLDDRDRAMLAGELGAGVQLAMELLVEVAAAQGATRMIDITAAHIDSCLYHGRAGLDFARRLAKGGARVSVPATLNVSSLDLLHPDLYRGDPETAAAARELMDAYVEMGCRPTWTCAPYQLVDRPVFEQQVAWGESNAIVFANSVIGARTERYGDFLDISCALTGRAPEVGLHTTEGRRATILLDLDVPDHIRDDELLYPVLGHVLGDIAGTRVAAVVGLDDRADEDRLKAMGAAAASSGAVAMFHAIGVTPEAPTLDAALHGHTPDSVTKVDLETLKRARASLGVRAGPIAAVSVGTPHFSASELCTLSQLTEGKTSRVPFFVNTGRDVLALVANTEVIEGLARFGATIVTDTCTYITPIIHNVGGVVMTNSAKWAFYAPGNMGVEVAFGSLVGCVDSAVAGIVVDESDWL